VGKKSITTKINGYEIFVELTNSASGMKLIKYQPAGRKENKTPLKNFPDFNIANETGHNA
jgi:hypothetical protein